jgi:hypothetical protein
LVKNISRLTVQNENSVRNNTIQKKQNQIKFDNKYSFAVYSPLRENYNARISQRPAWASPMCRQTPIPAIPEYFGQ